MNIATVRAKLRKGHKGTFRPLKVGEAIEATDVIVGDGWFSELSNSNSGRLCEKADTIMRLEFDK